MAENTHLPGFAGRITAALLVLGSCIGLESAIAPSHPTVSEVLASAAPLAVHSPADHSAVVDPAADLASAAPALVDVDGVPLRAEHAAVVRAVYRALAAGDLTALGALYAGNDWTGHAELLADELVRRSVLDALQTKPANLGEGYLYPGMEPGTPPDLLADSPTGHPGYQTAFFLDYDPPRTADGPLRWRGIATLPAAAPA